MNCTNCSDLIEDLIGGELDEPVAARASSHVFACPKCFEHYEMRRREREIYAGFLSAAEPPPDLWASFQTRLAAEKAKTSPAAETPAKASARGAGNIFGFLRPSPAFAFAAVLLVCFGIGFGWLKFAPVEKVAENESIAETNSTGNQPAARNFEETKSGETTISSIRNGSDKKPTATRQIRRSEPNNLLTEKNVTAANFGRGAPKANTKTFAVSEKRNEDSVDGESDDARLIEERRERLRLQDLETDTAKQIERAEMLLRSFRNARTAEGVESFDVAYEKRRARNLLEKNSELRRAAEGGGNLYAAELLNRVEPYLLDIANLEENSAPGKVQEIKERVRNQNIIVSLQVY